MKTNCLICKKENPKHGMKTCCRKCADELKKINSRETRSCLFCGEKFEVRKKDERQGIFRIPFKERTFEAGGAERGVYEGFISMFKELEAKAAKKQEYEKAIMWRDAIYKIENKTDIYDMVHVVELLRLEIPNEEVEKILDKYTDKYKKIRGGQPEQRS